MDELFVAFTDGTVSLTSFIGLPQVMAFAAIVAILNLIVVTVLGAVVAGIYNLMVKIYCLDNEHLMRTIFDKILQVQGVSSTQTYMSLNESFQREIFVDCLDY